MKKVITLCCAALLLPSFVFGPLPVWEKPSQVVLEGAQGNRVNGGSWSSDELVGAVHVLFYVDPDESDLNNAASDALKAEDFDKEQYRSVAIINMDATWLPNAVIQMRLESKQEEYPRTVYVRDNQKVLVEEWGLADDSSDIVLFDRDGTVLFSVDGQLTEVQIQELLGLIRERMNGFRRQNPEVPYERQLQVHRRGRSPDARRDPSPNAS